MQCMSLPEPFFVLAIGVKPILFILGRHGVRRQPTGQFMSIPNSIRVCNDRMRPLASSRLIVRYKMDINVQKRLYLALM